MAAAALIDGTGGSARTVAMRARKRLLRMATDQNFFTEGLERDRGTDIGFSEILNKTVESILTKRHWEINRILRAPNAPRA
jgi:hypothetical protein